MPLAGYGPATPVAVVVAVSHVLKGHINVTRLAFRSSVREGALGEIRAESYGIVFLKDRGHFEFVSEYYPMVHVVDGPPVHNPDPVEAVVDTIATILRIPTASTTMRQDAAERDIRRFIWEAFFIASPELFGPFRRALDDPDPRVRFNTITVLEGMTGRLPPSRDVIGQNERGYITKWKERLSSTRR